MIHPFYRSPKLHFATWPTAVCAVILLSSCSSLTSDKVNYKSQASAQPISLDIPPDLTQLVKDTRYRIPGEQVSANAMGLNTTNTSSPVIGATKLNDVTLSRLGKERWLTVQRAPEDVWPLVKQCWLDNGFVFVKEDEKLGLLETDWAENKANEPQDFFGKNLKRFLGNVMSTGIKDKFITRFEANDNKQVEIFISHRALEDVAPNSVNPVSSVKLRASDPELENEFLKKLMLRLGVSETQATSMEQSSGVPLVAKASLQMQGSLATLQYQEGFDTAWRRVGLALDRSGFTVEDRDRKVGLYFVRFVDRSNAGKEQGFFSRLFSSSSKEEGPQRYRIKIESKGDAQTSIIIQNSSGEADGSDAGAKIAQLLLDELK